MQNLNEIKSLGDWISKKDAMRFLGYKETQMCHFIKKYASLLEISKVGRRSFITKSSIIKVLEFKKLKK